ncbi:unnamed protein product [Fraxinus pennsylvanica]|uniref:Solute carrier family 35 member F1 n=1 Tax=Fraxinus pennsylvanica TaxID=56036 RepID=A0AAD2ADW5_9LAMI|nr:unnamed protein product [Fraxinus pennsylvanica]
MGGGWWRNHEGILRTMFILFLGQVVSFDIAIMSFTASLVATEGVDAPLTLSFFSYLALALVYGSVMLYRGQKLLVPWYWYVLLGFVDVHGNYLVNKAYEFSSITSVTILDCWTIPWVILLTWIFLGTKYSGWQFFGAAICLAGLGLVILSDAWDEGGGGGSKPLLGDVLVIAGTIFLALSNVGEEFCVKKKGFVEVVTMIGLFGMLVSAFEITILERKIFESVTWSAEIMAAFAAYTASSFMFYTLAPFVLQMSGSTLLNLSLLTSDMWAVVIRIFFYKQKVDWLYFLAFALVVIGIVIYSITKKDPESMPTIQDADHNPAYRLLDEENSDTRNDTAVSL